MAKEKKKEETEEEVSSEVQIPEKPKRRTSDIGLVPMIAIIGGTILAMILIVFALYWFLIRPDFVHDTGGSDSTKVELSDAEKARIKEKQEMARYEEEDAIGESTGVQFVQTTDIITNTSALDWFIVVQLGLEYRMFDSEEGAAEGAAATALDPRLESEVRSYVTKYFGLKTMDVVTAQRDSLESIFHKELKPIFLKHKMFLRRVSIPKFVTQRS